MSDKIKRAEEYLDWCEEMDTKAGEELENHLEHLKTIVESGDYIEPDDIEELVNKINVYHMRAQQSVQATLELSKIEKEKGEQ